MSLSVVGIVTVSTPFFVSAGVVIEVAGPYAVASGVFVPGVTRGQVFNAGAAQSASYIAGKRRAEVTR